MSARRSRPWLPIALIGALVGLWSVVAPVLEVPAAQAYDEDAIVQLVNEQRWADGSDGLIRNSDMDAVALAWAQQMASANTLGHNPDYASQIPIGWTAAAENVAQGYGDAASVMDGWMNSDGHRANILGGYTDIGVALIEGGGTTWAVQVFAEYPGHRGPSAPVAAAPVVPSQQAGAAPADTAAPAAPATATPTPTPSPTPTTTPRGSATPDPALGSSVERRSGELSPLTVLAVMLGLAALVMAAGSIWLTLRRRRLRSGDENWSGTGDRRSLDG